MEVADGRLRRVASCLFDHYLNCYEQNDGDANEGLRDVLSREFEEIVPNWRECRDEWRPPATGKMTQDFRLKK